MPTPRPEPSAYFDGGDAIDLLRRQHREIDQLLGALIEDRAPGHQARLRGELGDLIAVHVACEERVFYPGLTPAAVADEGRTFLVLAVEDHATIKGLLSELLRVDVGDRHFSVIAARLRDALGAHSRAEERLYPRIRRRLTRLQLRRLEYEMRVLEFELRTDAEPRYLFLVEDGAPAASA